MENSAKHKRGEEMFTLIESCSESGLSNKAFCVQQGLSQANFYYWKKKYHESQVKQEDKFIPVELPQSIHFINEIEIIYPNGVRLKLPQGQDLSVIRSFIGLL